MMTNLKKIEDKVYQEYIQYNEVTLQELEKMQANVEAKLEDVKQQIKDFKEMVQ